MWYSVVNPRSPGYANKVVATSNTREEALINADFWELEAQNPFFVISTPTKPAIGEVVDPNDLTEDERW